MKDTMATGHRVFRVPFATIYPLYVTKVERKGRTTAELDEVIRWLTGYSQEELGQAIEAGVDLTTFFERAPAMHPNAAQIRGVICGVRIEDIADPLMQKIRWLDKLVDELARGRALAKILR